MTRYVGCICVLSGEVCGLFAAGDWPNTVGSATGGRCCAHLLFGLAVHPLDCCRRFRQRGPTSACSCNWLPQWVWILKACGR